MFGSVSWMDFWLFWSSRPQILSPQTCDLGGPSRLFSSWYHDIMIHHDSQWQSLSTFDHMSEVITTIINVTLLKFNIYSPWKLASQPKGKYIVFQQSTSQGQNLKLRGCIQVEFVSLQNLCLANLCSSLIPLAPFKWDFECNLLKLDPGKWTAGT